MFSGGEGEYVRQTWTELLESEASRGAKRTQQGVDNVKWNGLNVIRDAVVRFVLLFWKVIKIREHALSFPLCFLYEWNSECFFTSFSRSDVCQHVTKAWTKWKTCPHARAHHPRVVKNVPKTRFSVFGRFLGVSLLPINTYFFSKTTRGIRN